MSSLQDVGALTTSSWPEMLHNKIFVALLGLLSHAFFAKGEPDNRMYIPVLVWMTVFSIMPVADYIMNDNVHSVLQALFLSWKTACIYFGSMSASILIYRAFFHRLRKFPGPFLARLSKVYSLRWVIPHNQYYRSAEKLHQQYGEIVRTGPRELSIANVDAVALIHSPSSRCVRGPWYSAQDGIELPSLLTEREKHVHRARRKIWDRAFNAKSLRDYEPRVNRHSQALIERLKEFSNDPSVEISKWINYWSFDVMGDVGFNHKFGMVESGKEDGLVTRMHRGMAPASYFNHINWALNLLIRPGIGVDDVLQLKYWARDVLRARYKIQPEENDIMGFIIDPNNIDIAKHTTDTILLVVAGSDTTASTVIWLCYELCRNPAVQAKLRKIIDAISADKAFLEVEELTDIPYLDGVINEALRLHPAVPSGVQRLTPPEGLILPSGPYRYIPGNTLVWTHIHTLQRNPNYFPSPLEFLPERWTDEMSGTHVLDKRAFQPFISGPYSCIGQKLSMMEMRTVVANLVREFEISFPEGDHGERLEKETKDCFTLEIGSLNVKLTPRKAETT